MNSKRPNRFSVFVFKINILNICNQPKCKKQNPYGRGQFHKKGRRHGVQRAQFVFKSNKINKKEERRGGDYLRLKRFPQGLPRAEQVHRHHVAGDEGGVEALVGHPRLNLRGVRERGVHKKKNGNAQERADVPEVKRRVHKRRDFEAIQDKNNVGKVHGHVFHCL